MNKIETLNELRGLLSDLLIAAQKLPTGLTYKDARDKTRNVPETCVISYDGELTASWRQLKPEKGVEVFRMTKTDRIEGPTSKRFNFYITRLAAFLDRKKLYPHRDIIGIGE